MVGEIVNGELGRLGKAVARGVCEHFRWSRQELFHRVQLGGQRSFAEVVAAHGRGHGCEVCKPAVASILASLWNEHVLEHATIQDTNDRYLANLQRGGSYSVVPRIPGGEITADKLAMLARVAKRYGLYVKITGGQRIDLLGARLGQLPDIWEDLVNAGFESGHAYGKAMRTVKSCVGSTWCRFGVQDSVAFAIRVENRYKGVRAPHKVKAAVSGCVRECAEAQSKDFGLIATEKGWNLYVCGNGGMKPRHAELLAADLDEETALRYVDRFLAFYIRTADRLTRTSVWLEKLEGGIEYLRRVIVDDQLGVCAELERHMQSLVDGYECEWKATVEDPAKWRRFREFVNSRAEDEGVEMVWERGQRRPGGAPPAAEDADPPSERRRVRLDVISTEWISVGSVEDFPADGGAAVRHGPHRIAVFHFAARGEWYATDNACPHTGAGVLSRGIVGDCDGTPKIACPMHKRTFALGTGCSLGGEPYRVRTYPVRVVEGHVLVELPIVEEAGGAEGREVERASA
jgi:nitrite reductase (NADH) large subunit